MSILLVSVLLCLSSHPNGDSNLKVVVSVQDAVHSPNLHYRIGIVNKESGKTEWGESIDYSTGKHPSVSLLLRDNVLSAVEIHRSDLLKSCYYRVGEVNVERKEIKWQMEYSQFLCHGLWPKISANNSGTVMVIMEKRFTRKAMNYCVGKVDFTNPNPSLSITWGGICFLADFQGSQPDVAINTSNQVVVACSVENTLQFKVGTINEDHTIRWNGSTSTLASPGIRPSISLNVHGSIVEVHQRNHWRQLSYCYGRVQSNEIIWGESQIHDNGEYPTISLSDDGYFYEMHKKSFGFRLFHVQGELKNRVTAEFPIEDPAGVK